MLDLLKIGIVFMVTIGLGILLFAGQVWIAANIIKAIFN